MSDSKNRFSNRVDDYIKYRPQYPAAIIDYLKTAIGLSRTDVVADIGAGTGISTELFLKNGNPTIAVEPNEAMREACRSLYGTYKNLRVADGSAENTTLTDASVDIVVGAQAFHWFDRPAFRRECDRILKPGGNIVLTWNERVTNTCFLQAYDELLKEKGTDYIAVDHRNIDAEALRSFFKDNSMQTFTTPNQQVFDWEGLRGRAMSSSYVPREGGTSDHFFHSLQQLFDRFQEQGTVTFHYNCLIYYGK